MSQVIRIPPDIYSRLESHAVGFASPASVIEMLLDFYEDNHSSQTVEPKRKPLAVELPDKLEIVFYPSTEEEFKSHFLKSKQAWILITRIDGSTEWKSWSLKGLTSTSSVMGNLRSGRLRDWKTRGIVKAEVAITKHDIQPDN